MRLQPYRVTVPSSTTKYHPDLLADRYRIASSRCFDGEGVGQEVTVESGRPVATSHPVRPGRRSVESQTPLHANLIIPIFIAMYFRGRRRRFRCVVGGDVSMMIMKASRPAAVKGEERQRRITLSHVATVIRYSVVQNFRKISICATRERAQTDLDEQNGKTREATTSFRGCRISCSSSV